MKTVGNNVHYCFANGAFPCLRRLTFILYAYKPVRGKTPMRFPRTTVRMKIFEHSGLVVRCTHRTLGRKWYQYFPPENADMYFSTI